MQRKLWPVRWYPGVWVCSEVLFSSNISASPLFVRGPLPYEEMVQSAEIILSFKGARNSCLYPVQSRSWVSAFFRGDHIG